MGKDTYRKARKTGRRAQKSKMRDARLRRRSNDVYEMRGGRFAPLKSWETAVLSAEAQVFRIPHPPFYQGTSARYIVCSGPSSTLVAKVIYEVMFRPEVIALAGAALRDRGPDNLEHAWALMLAGAAATTAYWYDVPGALNKLWREHEKRCPTHTDQKCTYTGSTRSHALVGGRTAPGHLCASTTTKGCAPYNAPGCVRIAGRSAQPSSHWYLSCGTACSTEAE